MKEKGSQQAERGSEDPVLSAAWCNRSQFRNSSTHQLSAGIATRSLWLGL